MSASEPEVPEAGSGNTTAHKRHGPTVRGYLTQIELTFRENSLYVGNLYVGGDRVLTKVIFDTRTKWTGVILDNAEGAENPSPYSLTASGSEIAYQPNGELERKNLKQGQDSFTGNVYREQICLFEHPSE